MTRDPRGPRRHRPARSCSSSPATTTATATPCWSRAAPPWPSLGLPGVGRRHRGRGRRHRRRALQRGARPSTTPSPRSSSSRAPPTWAWCRRRPASSRACGPSATASAPCSSSTRSSPASASARGGAQELARGHPRPHAPSARSSAAACPVGAFGGRADVMDELAPLGPVYQAGTLSGNPLATAAGLAALDLLDDDAYALIDLAGRLPRRCAGQRLRRRRHHRPSCPRWGSLVGLFFGATAPHDYASARTTDEAALRRASSTPCSTRASPWRPAPTRSCSPASPTTTRCSPPSPRPPRAPRPWRHPPSSTPPTATGPRRRGGPVPDDLEQAAIDTDVVVLFGATGDLAAKKIFPAIASLERRGRLGMPVVGVASSEWTDDDLRARAEESVAAAGGLDDVVAAAAPAHELRERRLPRPQDLRGPRASASGACSHPLFYLAIPPSLFDDVVQGLESVGPHRGRQGRGREALRPRPRALGRAQRGAAPRLPRVVGVPHRPLPRQGRHREPARVPLRQLAARAGLEPQLHPQHPDHDGRGLRHRRAGRSSTTPPARSATSCRTTCSRSSPCSAWSRRSPPTPTRCATRR